MLEITDSLSNEHKPTFYSDLQLMAAGLLEDDDDLISSLANLSSLLFWQLEDINWAGFYLLSENMLVLGPFQGKPACNRITIGQGVCGTAVAKAATQIVTDVHQFPGHIACDSASLSELVIPLFDKQGNCRGVLDIDSPSLARFDQQDAEGLLPITDLLINKWR
ncbi:GAF domain-containing protein [Zooshikella sp. RANM57]|uniref:GAF domain-containing protein n=1 Tax=Zooshikella sp. RANM57 TaxID=3425863 RepID=UPI003D6FF2E1